MSKKSRNGQLCITWQLGLIAFAVFLLPLCELVFQTQSVQAVTPSDFGEPKPVDFVINTPWRLARSVQFSYTYGPKWGKPYPDTHDKSDYYALDIILEDRTPIYPVAEGRVMYAGKAIGTSNTGGLGLCAYGNFVMIDHPKFGIQSIYAHLDSTSVVVGQDVTLQTQIGASGHDSCDSIGSHLHFALRRGATLLKSADKVGPVGGIAVVPEPLIGKEVYEGFGLRWGDSYLGWVKNFAPNSALYSGNLEVDSIAGRPTTGKWASSTTGNEARIGSGQSIHYALNDLPADTKEVRLTAYYQDWSIMSPAHNKQVWRILTRCWPDRPSEGGCNWSGTSALTFDWYPHDNTKLTAGAPWLPSGIGQIHSAFDTDLTKPGKPVCISFDVFDKSGQVSYAPDSTRCNITGLTQANTSPEALDSNSSNVSSVPQDNSSRLIYVLPASPQPSDPSWWLPEFSKADKPPLAVDIHIRVNWTSDFDAFRVCFDASNCQETSATELYYTWNTYGLADGNHAINIQYRRKGDSGDWNKALNYSEQFYLSPTRSGAAPCDGSDGVYLRSGSNCIRLTSSQRDLTTLDWSGRYELSVSVLGPMQAWAYSSVDYQGSNSLVKSGATQGVGSNVASIKIAAASLPPPPPPTSAFNCDAQTVVLYHFDENNGSAVNDACGRVNGTKDGSVSWGSGKFNSGISLPLQDGRSVNLGLSATLQVCPISVEAWIQQLGNGGGRVAGQLDGGPLKWLISLDGKKPKIEIWSAGGSQSAISYKEIPDSEWHLLVFTFDCVNTGKLYLDNDLVATVSTLGSWTNGATTLEIGSVEGINRFFGKVDEVRISNVVRTPKWESPIAEFNASTTSGPAPLSVDFTDLSQKTVSSWKWNFSDGALSNEKNPTHYFNAPGVYDVSLEVTGSGGVSTKIKRTLISVAVPSTPTPAPTPSATPPSTLTSVTQPYGGIYGGIGGEAFIDTLSTNQWVIGFRICVGDAIDTVTTIFNTGTQLKHGTSTGGICTDITLGAGEYIVGLKGYSNESVRQITLITSEGRSLGPFGKPWGTTFDIRVPVGGEIVGFQGRSGWFIDAIGVVARLRSNNLTPTSTLQPVVTSTPTSQSTECTLTINNGALYTNQRQISVNITAAKTNEMKLSNDGGFANTVWQAYQSTTSWMLNDPGSRIATLLVYAKVRANQNTPLCNDVTLIDDVVYDPLPPSVRASIQSNSLVGTKSSSAESGNFTLSLIATDQPGGGLADMQISGDSTFAGSTWQEFRPTVSMVANDGETIFVRVRDKAGNLSPVASTIVGKLLVYMPIVRR